MIMEEGRRMRHCVASYMNNVVSGKTHLFSVRREMRRVATMQIVGKRVVQIAAFANKVAPYGAVNAAHKYASEQQP
jgi:hypothetical protein